MKRSIHGLVLFLLGAIFSYVSDGLYCYSCAGTTSNTTCVTNVSGLVKTRYEYDGPFNKDCDLEINQTMCIIETVEGDGKLKSIIRGCSDGFTFSFTEIKLFRHLSPTNQTQCAMYMGQLICITLCRHDYCNGPQTDNENQISSGSRIFNLELMLLPVMLYM